MTFRVTLVLLACLTASISAAPSSYFPLTPGAAWVRGGGDGAQITVRVLGSKTLAGAGCTIVETTSVRTDRTRVSRSCYRTTPGAVLAVEAETAGRTVVLDPPRPLMMLPPAPGKTWTWLSKSPPGAPETLTWVGEEAVRVPAGAFRAWKVRMTTTRGILTFTLDTWYAAGVGVVKIQREISGQGREAEGSSELVSYRIP